MDANNYVAPTGNGQFVVVRDGKIIGTYSNQAVAEQAYNAYPSTSATTAPATSPTSYTLAAGYGMLDPALAAQDRALQAQAWNLNRWAQAGTTPVTLQAGTNYYDLLKGIPTGDKNAWVQQAVVRSGLPEEIVAKAYDMMGGVLPTADEFSRILDTAASTGLTSFDAKRWKDQKDLADAQMMGYSGDKPTLAREQYQTSASGYMNGNPTLAREQAQWSAGQQMANLAASLRGPENYFQYANAMRNAEGSPQLAFAQQMASGKPLSAFGSWGESKPVTLQSLLGMTGAGNASQASTLPGASSQGFRYEGPMTGEATTSPVANSGNRTLNATQQAWLEYIQGQKPNQLVQGPVGLTGSQGFLPGEPSPSGSLPSQPDKIVITPGGAQPGGMTQTGSASQIPTPAAQQPTMEIAAPHQLNMRDYLKMFPTEKKLQESAMGAGVKFKGSSGIHAVQPEDYWATFQRAAPKGQAATSIRFR